MTGNDYKVKWYNSLLFRLVLIFFIFAFCIVSASALGIYFIQQNEYMQVTITRMNHIANHVEAEIIIEGDTFAMFQKYMAEHYDEVFIPYDFDKTFVQVAKLEFERGFNEVYADKIFGTDISFDELPDKLKLQFCTYYQAKWFLYFEDIRTEFDIPYSYYVYPSGEGSHVIYMFDTERILEGDDEEMNQLHLLDDYEEDYDELANLFKTWETGKVTGEVDTFDNEYGRTYSYYQPLYINNEKLGIICIDFDIDYVKSMMTENVFVLSCMNALITLAFFIVLILVIARIYLKRVHRLLGYSVEYTNDKDIGVVRRIRNDMKGNDEVAVLARALSDMITELDNHIISLIRKESELKKTQKQAAIDSLTGVRNRFAYDEEVRKIQWAIDKGETDVTIVMVDLNYLKKLNDTFGHERGDLALRNLCKLICDTYKHSKVFRIGGDEFVVILRGESHEHKDELYQEFVTAIQNLSSSDDLDPWEGISAAIGMSSFDPTTDVSIENVFKKADTDMYENKRRMKAMRHS